MASYRSDADAGFWPLSDGLLVELCSFWAPLHWPLCIGPPLVDDLGVGGVWLVEFLILYERWAGERLVLAMSVPKHRRSGRPISVSAVPSGPSIDIWRSCRFLGAMLSAFGGLLGGQGRFLPCPLGDQSLWTSVCWLGKVWSWSYVQALGGFWFRISG